VVSAKFVIIRNITATGALMARALPRSKVAPRLNSADAPACPDEWPLARNSASGPNVRRRGWRSLRTPERGGEQGGIKTTKEEVRA
jgi:hypothetical protein